METLKSDWIQHAKFRKWLHKLCFVYRLFCNSRGRARERKDEKKETKH
jgi:hypothetical protein